MSRGARRTRRKRWL